MVSGKTNTAQTLVSVGPLTQTWLASVLGQKAPEAQSQHCPQIPTWLQDAAERSCAFYHYVQIAFVLAYFLLWVLCFWPSGQFLHLVLILSWGHIWWIHFPSLWLLRWLSHIFWTEKAFSSARATFTFCSWLHTHIHSDLGLKFSNWSLSSLAFPALLLLN